MCLIWVIYNIAWIKVDNLEFWLQSKTAVQTRCLCSGMSRNFKLIVWLFLECTCTFTGILAYYVKRKFLKTDFLPEIFCRFVLWKHFKHFWRLCSSKLNLKYIKLDFKKTKWSFGFKVPLNLSLLHFYLNLLLA